MLQKKSSGMARAKSLLVLPLLCTAVLAFAETKYVPVEGKDSETSQNVVKTTDDNVLVLVNGKSAEKVSIRGNKDNVLFIVDGKIVKSIDDITSDRIESMTVIKDKEQMKQYGKVAEGKDGVIVVTLKEGVETPQSLENCLFVVDGKIVESLDDITTGMIESMTVIKDKKQMKKYGKAVKGKDGVIEVKLRANSDSEKEPALNGKVITVRTSTDGGKELKVLKMKGNSDSEKDLELNGKVISVQTPADGGNVLYVVDGKVVKSIDNIAPDRIESMTVIKDKEQMKKYGKAAKGKNGVIEVKLKSEK